MKQTVTESMFIDSFIGGYKDNFSYEGKKALFEYLEQYEDDYGLENEIELNPISLCCEYSEYESAVDCIDKVGYDCDYKEAQDDDDDGFEEYALDWLQDQTTVITHDKGIIILVF